MNLITGKTFDEERALYGTQPLCYCKNLRLINCEMVDTDLSFERLEVEATLTALKIQFRAYFHVGGWRSHYGYSRSAGASHFFGNGAGLCIKAHRN